MCVWASLDGSRWCLYTCTSSGNSNHNVETGQGVYITQASKLIVGSNLICTIETIGPSDGRTIRPSDTCTQLAIRVDCWNFRWPLRPSDRLMGGPSDRSMLGTSRSWVCWSFCPTRPIDHQTVRCIETSGLGLLLPRFLARPMDHQTVRWWDHRTVLWQNRPS